MQKWCAGGRPLLRENLAKTGPPSSKTPISNQYSFVAPQHLAKKVQLENVAIANALQKATPALSRFTYDAMPSLQSLNLSIALL